MNLETFSNSLEARTSPSLPASASSHPGINDTYSKLDRRSQRARGKRCGQVAAGATSLRRVGKTPMNAESSRSHLLIRISTEDLVVVIGDIAGNEPYRRFTDPRVRAQGQAIVGNFRRWHKPQVHLPKMMT